MGVIYLSTKSVIRPLITQQLKELSTEYRCSAAVAVASNLKALLDSADTIAVYRASSLELDLAPVIRYCVMTGKNLYQPIAYKHSKVLRFDRYDASFTDIFYSPEHQLIDEIKWYNLELILMPLVAVDRCGVRLGKGGGYYDATLAQIGTITGKPVLCGVGFDLQLVDEIPSDSWDIKLDYFVSDKRIYKFI